MATATKKKTTAKTAAKVEVELVLTKVTKNTYRFDAEDKETSAVATLYVNQSAFTKEPAGIKVTVESV